MPDSSRTPAAPSPAAQATAEYPAETQERRGCLFALSQPPLMIFLAVIGCLLLSASLHDLLFL
ncbi:hypothetical protein [Streptomyces physcomitrii]|uniref:Uncharacterized protein n=1 Tax=Streptomyces physcomitrii TaxID=2724184 RepID=A0ABX1H9W3_9ACTN|nr:hypothetical protein [Streptomyces physcomitrii]NKI44029.1 hypothetical protein [Streptomyces physcomitrii]